MSSALRRPTFRPKKNAPSGLIDSGTDQILGFKLAHDHRSGLRRKAGHARNVGLGQVSMRIDEAEHQALVIGAQAALV